MVRRDAGLHTVYIGIGANLGRRIYALDHARTSLESLGSSVACSAVYETTPVGYADQPDFLNMVARFSTTLRPLQLLEALLDVEANYGRQRTIRNGPRTLDMDLLLYDHEYVCFQSLQVPHPRMWERGFVMVPLADLAPDMSAPGGRTVRELALHYRIEGDIRYVGRFW